ncbi:MAG: FAD-dependent oxidoreductase, partial [Maribacter sp.]
AIQLKKSYPKASILIMERGVLPQGASTKNAGFACFGSISEILADMEHHTEEELVNLVKDRWKGIQALRSLLGDKAIGYQQHGGHELFLEQDSELFYKCLEKMGAINSMLHPIFEEDAFSTTTNLFGFQHIKDKYITHRFEGQIDTGKMMKSLLQKAMELGISVMNSTSVTSFEDQGNQVLVQTDSFEFECKKLLVATNGFASQLLKEKVKPARSQVLITKPIHNLSIEGTFHLEEGYYYFRNIDNRILLGGGRNLDFSEEETTDFGNTAIVQDKLEELLNRVILPNTPFEIDYGWSGIMGVGPQKKPVLKLISGNVACGVRLGGMGIAIGTSVGQKLARIFE